VISSLNGLVQRTGANFVVLDVAGVGYLVSTTTACAHELRVGEPALLHTALIVREDAFTLFGFQNTDELELFDLLRSVTGVGPKSALAILSQLSIGAIRDAVLSENDATFKAVSGIGPKTAKLITVTLAGKLAGFAGQQSSATAQQPKPSVDLTTVVQALQGLGWPERQATDAVREAAEAIGAGATPDTLLRAALARLSGSKTISGGDR
jgi:Holliday junction DNA helicase RuvA